MGRERIQERDITLQKMTRPITLIIQKPASSLLFIASGHAFAIIDSTNHTVVAPANLFTPNLDKSSSIRTACFSNDGSILVTSGEDKRILVWCTSQWGSLIHQHNVEKRLVQICIPNDLSALICADKHGDIWRFPIEGKTSNDDSLNSLTVKDKGQVIAGHVSMVTTASFLANDSLLISADRDEKIRISHYPDSYNIHSFLMGHQHFVSHVFPVNDLLVSAGGDDFILLWNWPTAKIVHKADLRPHIDQNQELVTVRSLSVANFHVALIIEGTNFVLVFMIDPVLKTVSFYQKIMLAGHFGLALSTTFDSTHHLWIGAMNGLVVIELSMPTPSSVDLSHFGDAEVPSLDDIFMHETYRKTFEFTENGENCDDSHRYRKRGVKKE